MHAVLRWNVKQIYYVVKHVIQSLLPKFASFVRDRFVYVKMYSHVLYLHIYFSSRKIIRESNSCRSIYIEW